MSTINDVVVRDSAVLRLKQLSDRSACTTESSSCFLQGKSYDDDALSEFSLGDDETKQQIVVVEHEAWVESTSDAEVLPSGMSGRKVSWGEIEIRLYPIIPGDHPDTCRGPPVRFFQ